MRIRQLMGDSQPDAAAPAAKIEHARRRMAGPQHLQRQIRDGHRVVTRDQDVRRDLERDPVEIPLPEDIGQRLMGEHSVYITVQICFDLLAGIQVGIRQHGGDGFPGRKRQQLARGGCGILTFCGQQRPPGLQIQVSVLFYHRSAPASSGRTSFSASMPTSSMESSGSLVVKFWNHMPGAVRIRVSQLSWRPTRRLNS